MENQSKSGVKIWKFIFPVVIVVLLIVFAVQNSQDTEIAFFTWSGTAPLVIILAAFFLCGLIFAWLWSWLSSRNLNRKNKEIMELQIRLKEAEEKIRKQKANEF